MKVFLDEAGSTGCVINNKEIMNFGTQRHFSLCGVIARDENDEKKLRKKYDDFKNKFKITNEFKGNSLLTRENNEQLDYFINKIINGKHFSLCLYDKKFYLSCLMLIAILGEDFQKDFSVDFYELASCLSNENNILFVEYSKMISRPTDEALRSFLKFIVSFDYRFMPKSENPLIMMAENILADHNEEMFINNFLSPGSYDNPNYTNVINLNALSELIFTIKRDNNLSNEQYILIHDAIDGFSETFISELAAFNISVSFSDSKDDVLIQMADNVASIIYKIMNDMVLIFEARTEWNPKNEWKLTIASRLFNKIDLNNIKFTIPIQNWAVAICVRHMFDEKYPKNMRSNLYFNQYYQEAIYNIKKSIAATDFNINHIMNFMKK